MAMDGRIAFIRNLIGEQTFLQITQKFDEINQHGENLVAGINALLQNQKIMEANANRRHAEILSLFAQLGVRPIPDAAALLESPAKPNGKGNDHAEFQPGESGTTPSET